MQGINPTLFLTQISDFELWLSFRPKLEQPSLGPNQYFLFLLARPFQDVFFLKKWANPGLFFVYFHSFLVTISIQIEKSVDGVLGIQTQGRRMVGADETTELWRPHFKMFVYDPSSLEQGKEVLNLLLHYPLIFVTASQVQFNGRSDYRPLLLDAYFILMVLKASHQSGTLIFILPLCNLGNPH